MTAPVFPQEGAATPTADIYDDLFDYDANIDDILPELDTNFDVPAKKSQGAADAGASLGVDEDIKITKKRRPVAKLDETRLLSQAGIPKLRRTAKQRLRFKGKGHEVRRDWPLEVIQG